MSVDSTSFMSFLSHSDVLPALVAGLMTMLGASLTGALALKDFRFSKNKDRDIDLIAETVNAKVLEAQARATEAILTAGEAGKVGGIRIDKISAGGSITIAPLSAEDRQLIENLVTNYHQQALSQARVQFWFSVIAATIGFIYILYGAITARNEYVFDYLKVTPGVIIDAIAVLFFKQAEQTRQRATELYDRLRTDRQMLRAETVVNTIEDVSIRSAVKAQITLHMVGLAPKEIDLQ